MTEETPKTIYVSGGKRVPPYGHLYEKTSDDPEKVVGRVCVITSDGKVKLVGNPLDEEKIYGILPHQLQNVPIVNDQYDTTYARDNKPITVIQEDRLLVRGILDQNQTIKIGDLLSATTNGLLEKWGGNKPVIGIAMENKTTGSGEFVPIMFDFYGIHANAQVFTYQETLSVSSNEANCTFIPLAFVSVRATAGTYTGLLKVTDTDPNSGEVLWMPGGKTLEFNSGDAITSVVVTYLCTKQR